MLFKFTNSYLQRLLSSRMIHFLPLKNFPFCYLLVKDELQDMCEKDSIERAKNAKLLCFIKEKL